MSTYSHLSVIKINTVKSMKLSGKRKNRKQEYGIARALHVENQGSINTWYSNNAYPVLAD